MRSHDVEPPARTGRHGRATRQPQSVRQVSTQATEISATGVLAARQVARRVGE
jgi:hypothetical protein